MVLTLSRHDGVALVTLNRPEAMNAIDPELRAALHATWDELATDDEAQVIVLTGEGNRAFCVGADLKKTMPPAQSRAAAEFGSTRSDHLLTGMDIAKPIICAINGFALGGGLEIALACDIRIAAESARFGLTEAKVGTIPGAGGTQLLPRIVGHSKAMQMMLTAEMIDAAAALQWGLVSEVVPDDELPARAMAIAQSIAANAPLSVRAIKRLVNRGADMSIDTAIEMERFVWGLLRDTEDRIEGRKAFQEKRPPNYQGK